MKPTFVSGKNLALAVINIQRTKCRECEKTQNEVELEAVFVS